MEMRELIEISYISFYFLGELGVLAVETDFLQ
jgi:hypothetical protein